VRVNDATAYGFQNGQFGVVESTKRYYMEGEKLDQFCYDFDLGTPTSIINYLILGVCDSDRDVLEQKMRETKSKLGIVMPSGGEIDGGSYASAYADLLESDPNDPYLTGMFLLAYIDEDDIPEMIVSPSIATHYTGVEIFTYYNNEVIDLGCYGSFGMVSFGEKTGIIQSNWTGMGGSENDFYKLSEGEVEFIGNLTELDPLPALPDDPEMTTVYEIDGAEVSQDDYQRKMTELRSSGVFLYLGYDNGCEVAGNIDRLRDAPSQFIITSDILTAAFDY